MLRLTSDLVVGVAPTSTRALERVGLSAGKSATVYNGLSVGRTRSREDIRRELSIPEDAELIVTVGRYTPEKNQGLLLEALAKLAPLRPSLHALVVGVGELEDELRQKAAELAIDARVRITGPRTDAHNIIGAADVFALSSESEGLPLVVLEAMALGVVVASTDVGAVGDAVVDRETGMLVRPRDASALAEALANLLDDEELRHRLAAAARAWAEATCTEETMGERYVELYVEAVSRRKRRTKRRTGASPSK